MPPAKLTSPPCDLFALLANPETRVEAGVELAARHGATDCILFIEDEQAGRFLPAPGFGRTLPDRDAWAAFLGIVQQEGSATRELQVSGSRNPVPVTGFALGHGGVIAFVSQSPVQKVAEDLAPMFPVVIRMLQQEQCVTALTADRLIMERRTQELEAWSVRLEKMQEELNLALIAARVAKSRTENTLEGIEDAFMMVDTDGRITYLNSAAEELCGLRNGVIGTRLDELAGTPHSAHLMRAWKDAHERKQSVMADYAIAGEEASFVVRVYPSVDGATLFVSDVSSRYKMERLVEQLSTPVLHIAHRMLLLPLIGHIDEVRAQQMLDQFSGAIHRHRARAAVIDITGVYAIGQETAQLLVHAVRAARLLGCATFTVGISPEVAESFVDAGINPGQLDSRSDLQAGIEAGLDILRDSA